MDHKRHCAWDWETEGLAAAIVFFMFRKFLRGSRAPIQHTQVVPGLLADLVYRKTMTVSPEVHFGASFSFFHY